MESKFEDSENPATLILMDLYKGSTYKIRKMVKAHHYLDHSSILQQH